MQANYSAGNLEFAVQTISSATLSQLDVLNSKLTTTMTLLKQVSSLTKGMGVAKGTKSNALSSIKSVSKATTANDLARLMGSQYLGDGKSSGMGAFKITNLLNKIYFLRNYTRQMVTTLKRALNYGIEYAETLNLWQVAMRDNRKEAEEFV